MVLASPSLIEHRAYVHLSRLPPNLETGATQLRAAPLNAGPAWTVELGAAPSHRMVPRIAGLRGTVAPAAMARLPVRCEARAGSGASSAKSDRRSVGGDHQHRAVPAAEVLVVEIDADHRIRAKVAGVFDHLCDGEVLGLAELRFVAARSAADQIGDACEGKRCELPTFLSVM